MAFRQGRKECTGNATNDFAICTIKLNLPGDFLSWYFPNLSSAQIFFDYYVT